MLIFRMELVGYSNFSKEFRFVLRACIYFYFVREFYFLLLITFLNFKVVFIDKGVVLFDGIYI